MSSNPDNLPYFKIKSSEKELMLTKFLKRKFLPKVKERFDRTKRNKKKSIVHRSILRKAAFFS